MDFAQKHLFRNGLKTLEDEGEEDELESYQDDSCFTDQDEDETFDEANLTDPSNSPEASVDTN